VTVGIFLPWPIKIRNDAESAAAISAPECRFRPASDSRPIPAGLLVSSDANGPYRERCPICICPDDSCARCRSSGIADRECTEADDQKSRKHDLMFH
jgi:hypothetical protein